MCRECRRPAAGRQRGGSGSGAAARMCGHTHSGICSCGAAPCRVPCLICTSLGCSSDYNNAPRRRARADGRRAAANLAAHAPKASSGLHASSQATHSKPMPTTEQEALARRLRHTARAVARAAHARLRRCARQAAAAIIPSCNRPCEPQHCQRIATAASGAPGFAVHALARPSPPSTHTASTQPSCARHARRTNCPGRPGCQGHALPVLAAAGLAGPPA